MLYPTTVKSESTHSETKTNWFASFSGLIPVFFLVFLVLLHQWTLSIVVSIASSLITMGLGLLQKRTPSSLELLSLAFGLVNVILYFGYHHNTFLLQHLGIFIYTILLLQVVSSLMHDTPWTEQYARRAAPENVWHTPLFHSMNRFITVVWGITFVLCDVLSLSTQSSIRTFVPLALLAITALSTPKLVAWYTDANRQ